MEFDFEGRAGGKTTGSDSYARGERRIVLPGEQIFAEPRRIPGTVVEGGATIACVVGFVQEDKFVPLKGHYLPRVGDFVVGIVKDQRFSGYVLDLNSPYEGSLSSKELREDFELGDVVAAEVIEVNEVHDATLARPRKLFGGEILEITPVKVPRVIGRAGSMLTVIKQFTHTDVSVGKNGRLYLKGGNTALATLAILKICREAHLSGLTDRVTAFLREESEKNGRSAAGSETQIHA
ncbi:MAG: exosome complex protein Rrp4 [Candidatus Norongarragalinales archaeon]